MENKQKKQMNDLRRRTASIRWTQRSSTHSGHRCQVRRAVEPRQEPSAGMRSDRSQRHLGLCDAAAGSSRAWLTSDHSGARSTAAGAPVRRTAGYGKIRRRWVDTGRPPTTMKVNVRTHWRSAQYNILHSQYFSQQYLLSKDIGTSCVNMYADICLVMCTLS